MQNDRILVIGSKSHERANCLDWLEPFPNIEEYDSVIVNMQSLSQQDYDKIRNKIADLKESFNIILETGRQVFCILNKTLYPSPPKPSNTGYVSIKTISENYFPPTNFDWLPSKLHLDNRKSGDHIQLVNQKFKTYFSFIQKWYYEIGFLDRIASSDLNVIEPIALNKSERVIAGSLHKISDRKKLLNEQKIGIVHLLPPPEKEFFFQAIETIIDTILGEGEKAAIPWRKDIDILLDQAYRVQLEKKLTDLENIQKDIKQLQEKIQSLDCYRDLLTETGDPLENIVKKILDDIGISTKKAEKGFPADLLNKDAVVEITGIKGSIGVDSNKVTQTNRYIQNYRRNNEKVILIVNTYRTIPPDDRKGRMNFTPEMIRYLNSLSIGYMTTNTLYELWKDVILGRRKKEQIKQKILSTIGEVTV